MRRGVKEKESVISTIASLVAKGVLGWEGLETVREVRSQCYLLSQEAGVGVQVNSKPLGTDATLP